MDYQMTLPHGENVILEESKPEDIGKNKERLYAIYESVRKAGGKKDNGRDS